MPWRRRSWWVAVAAVLYVGVAALRAAPGASSSWAAVVLGLAVLSLGWRLAAPPVRGPDRIDPLARSAARVVATATAVALVAELGPEAPSFMAAPMLGLAMASVASLVALGRVASLGGIAARPTRGRQLDAAALAAVPWTVALGLAVARTVAPARTAALEQAAIDLALVAAALGSLGIAFVASLVLYAARRFELGVAERAAASLWLSVLCLAIGLSAALMSVARPETIVPLSALTGAVCVTAAAISQQPARVSRALRTAVALTVLCAPLAAVAVVVVYKVPTRAGLVLFAVTIAASLTGLLARPVAEQLAPERGRWLQALRRALRAAKAPEPRQVLAGVLVAIRDGMPRSAAPAKLLRLASEDAVYVDRAGYLHTEPAELPERLVALAEQEPERVLSVEALRYVEVTRPEVRPLVEWMDVRGAGAVALVLDEEVCVGLLQWPSARRRSPLASEEAEAMRRLADHLGAAIGADAQLARSRARELAAEQEVAAARAGVDSLQATADRESGRRRALAEAKARPVRVACYSPAAQTALAELERLARSGRPVALLAPRGIDAVSWAAAFHLASARADGVLHVVDAAAEVATGEAEQASLERWQDPARSPLALARCGTLLVLNAHALPQGIQRYLGHGLREEQTGLVVALVSAATELGAAGDLEQSLVERLGDRALGLPPLAERAEDLRALAMHHLYRLGMRLRGRPYGLSLQGQALLNEYPWPGNDAELEAVLVQAVLASETPVVDRSSLAGLLPPPHGPSSASSPSPDRPADPERAAG